MTTKQSSEERVIQVTQLAKTFSLGFRRRRVEAVKDISFSVYRGEIFGLVGPNGAGKTTAMKAIMGLITPTRGHIEILGTPVPAPASRAKVGYLPEISYYYDYLTPEEFLDFYGRLYALDARTRRQRVPQLLERVGLADAIGKPLRKFSKGMLQRIGLAQALIADPEIVMLDEPQSGLDPLGRKDVTDLIHETRAQGKTIFFSSHILQDVERVCDRVAVMIHGRIVDIGPMSQLLNPRTLSTEIAVQGVARELIAGFESQGLLLRVLTQDPSHTLVFTGDCDIGAVIAKLIEAGAQIESVVPRRESLEDVFVREAIGTQEERHDRETPTEATS